MYVGSANIPPISLRPGPQERFPADRPINLKTENGKKYLEELDISRLKELVASARNSLNGVELQFSVHKPSGRMVTTVREKSSGKVLRQVPSSELLKIAAKVHEMVGMLFDKSC